MASPIRQCILMSYKKTRSIRMPSHKRQLDIALSCQCAVQVATIFTVLKIAVRTCNIGDDITNISSYIGEIAPLY